MPHAKCVGEACVHARGQQDDVTGEIWILFMPTKRKKHHVFQGKILHRQSLKFKQVHARNVTPRLRGTLVWTNFIFLVFI
jgi:hypothetical protein